MEETSLYSLVTILNFGTSCEQINLVSPWNYISSRCFAAMSNELCGIIVIGWMYFFCFLQNVIMFFCMHVCLGPREIKVRTSTRAMHLTSKNKNFDESFDITLVCNLSTFIRSWYIYISLCTYEEHLERKESIL